jgi:hypothetical protein
VGVRIVFFCWGSCVDRSCHVVYCQDMTKFGHSVRDGIVYVRKAGKSDQATRQLTVPAHFARQVPEGAAFRVEWHPDGLLYRFLGVGYQPVEQDAPEWVRGD